MDSCVEWYSSPYVLSPPSFSVLELPQTWLSELAQQSDSVQRRSESRSLLSHEQTIELPASRGIVQTGMQGKVVGSWMESRLEPPIAVSEPVLGSMWWSRK